MMIRALMMEAVRTSEMSFNIYQTMWHNIPEAVFGFTLT
jgi:hypothetical protein